MVRRNTCSMLYKLPSYGQATDLKSRVKANPPTNRVGHKDWCPLQNRGVNCKGPHQ